MKNVFISAIKFLVPLLFVFWGCDDEASDPNDAIRGSGKIVTQLRTVEDCSAILLRYAGSVYLSQDNVQTIRIEADDNIIDNVLTREHNGVLETGLKNGNYSDITLRIYVSLKTITSLSIDGAGNISAQNSFESNGLVCSISGAGNIFIKGSGNFMNCSINGAGNIDAENFISEKCTASVNGAGNATVYASEELFASINGVGSIIYYGNPENVTTSVTGLGHIIRR